MRSNSKATSNARTIFVGVDVHASTWHVTIRDCERGLKQATINGSWEDLKKMLLEWSPSQIMVVYEAGFSGFWLYDEVISWGGGCIVVPPSRIPVESGNRIKTDRRDSAKLAQLAALGQAAHVRVPKLDERYNREAIRERYRLVREVRRVQCQIKAQLHCYGLHVYSPRGCWSRVYESRLWQLRFESEPMQTSFERLLERYRFLREQLLDQTRLIRRMSRQEEYRERVAQLTSMPGIGILTAMELLLELGDMNRFRRADHLAAYVGLTPSEYSSGPAIRRGHISRCGKAALRSRLVEASWIAIRYDAELREIYERIRARRGGRRAIVGVARRLLLRVRRVLADGRDYHLTPRT